MAADGVKRDDGRPGNAVPGWAKGIVLILVVATLCWLARDLYRNRNPDVQSDGKVVASVVVTSFRSMGDLRVSRIAGIVQGVGTDRGLGNMLPSTYVMKAPFQAGYFVDLSKLDRQKAFWDETGRILTVTVPDVRLDDVNVDETRKTVDRTGGIFVSRGAMTSMRQQASTGARKAAQDEAAKPERMIAARDNGRSQIAALFARPLRAVGVDATVKVRYAGEPVDDERMDRSRSIADILSGR